MIIKTIVPKLGEAHAYLGKPVTNECGVRIGSISEVKDVGDHYELIMNVSDDPFKPKTFNNAVMGVSFDE